MKTNIAPWVRTLEQPNGMFTGKKRKSVFTHPTGWVVTKELSPGGFIEDSWSIFNPEGEGEDCGIHTSEEARFLAMEWEANRNKVK